MSSKQSLWARKFNTKTQFAVCQSNLDKTVECAVIPIMHTRVHRICPNKTKYSTLVVLLYCALPYKQVVRENLYKMWLSKVGTIAQLLELSHKILITTPAIKMTIILDPSSMPEVLELCQP